MADRNSREVVDIGKFQPYDHPQYGAGAVREITYIDGTIERRFFFHGTGREGEGAPDSGYLVDSKVDPKLRDDWNRNAPAEARTPARTPEQARADAANATKAEQDAAEATRVRNESSWNADPANRANGGSGRYEDHATRDARLDKERKEKEEKDRVESARPGTKIGSKVEVRNGTRVTVETWRLPNGTTEERISEEPEPVKPGTVIKGGGPNGEDVQAVAGPDGRISYQPITGATTPAGSKPLPAGVPPFRPDHTKPEYGLGEWIDTYLMPLWRDGKIDKEQVTQAVTQATAAAKSEETRIANSTRVQENQQTAALTQRGQDIGRSNQMASLATTGMQAALGESDKLRGLIAPGSWNGSTSVPILAMQAAHIGAMGGGGQFAPVQPGPLLASMNQFGGQPAGPFPGIGAPGAAPAPPAAPVAAAPTQLVRIRNRTTGDVTEVPLADFQAMDQAAWEPIGVVGSNAPQRGETGYAPPSPERTADIMANPVFRPQPVTAPVGAPPASPGAGNVQMAPAGQSPVMSAFSAPYGRQFDLAGEIARMRQRDPNDPGWQQALDELLLGGLG